MEVILSKQCESLTGMLGRGFGYHIQRRKNGFFAKRDSKGPVPPDGHWRFIVACATLAQNKLHIAGIKVTVEELDDALTEATNGVLQTSWAPVNAVVNADQVIQLKKELNL